jgi:hypothetical protein
VLPNASISCRVGTKDGDFDCTVESEATLGGTKAVKLVSPAGGCKYGVFVQTKQPIKYTGETEWAMMDGSMLLPDPSIDRSFSKIWAARYFCKSDEVDVEEETTYSFDL